MRSIQRDQRAALATFHDTYDLRRAMWQEHQRKLREARERRPGHQQSERSDEPVNVSALCLHRSDDDRGSSRIAGPAGWEE